MTNFALVMINFTGNGPFDQDLAIPVPAVPLLEPALRLKILVVRYGSGVEG